MNKIVTIALLLFIFVPVLAVSCSSSSTKGSVLGSEMVYGNTTSCGPPTCTDDSFQCKLERLRNPGPTCNEVTLHVTVQNIGDDGTVTVYARINYNVTYPLPDNVRYRETEVYLKQGEDKTVFFNFWVPEERTSWTYQIGTN